MAALDTFADISRRTGERLSRLGDFLAGMTIWRFIVFALLLLIAAGMAEGVFDFSPRRPVIQITQAPAPPLPPPAPGTDVKGAERDVQISIGEGGVEIKRQEATEGPADEAPTTIDKEFRVHIGEDGLTIRGRASDKEVAAIHELVTESSRKALESQFDAKLDAAMKEARRGLLPSVSLPQVAIFLILLLFIVRFLAKSKVRAEARAVVAESAADTAALERQLAEARLQAMQAQVEPHFLFNTLAAVEHLIETDPPRAAGMQRNLIAYLRSVLPNLRQGDSTLGREVEISRNYLEILKVRMESRLEFGIDVPAGLETAAMPPLMLQSLVENAIEHGLEPKPEGGHIAIAAAVKDGQLIVSVSDTGNGFAPDSDGAGTTRNGTRGVGLSSIRERLAALFDGRGRLIIAPNVPSGTRATIEFPYVFKPAASRTDRG